MFVGFGSSVDNSPLLSRNRICVAFRLSISPPLSHLANGQPLQSYKLNVVRRLLEMTDQFKGDSLG